MNKLITAKFMLDMFLEKLNKNINEAKAYAETIKGISESMYHLALSYLAEAEENNIDKARAEARKAYMIAQDEFPDTRKVNLNFFTHNNPTRNIAALKRWGDTAYRSEKYRSALEAYDMLIALGQESFQELYNFVQLLINKEYRGVTKKYGDRMFEKAPYLSIDVLRLYIRACISGGFTSDAETLLEEMLNETEDPEVAYELGQMYLYNTDGIEKEKVLRVINILDKTKEPDSFELKGQLFNKIDMPKDAVVQFLRGATIAYERDNKPNSHFVQSQRMFAEAVETLIGLGEKEKAKAIVKRAENLISVFDNQYGKMLKMRFGNIL